MRRATKRKEVNFSTIFLYKKKSIFHLIQKKKLLSHKCFLVE